ncbi:MAG: hypothetical protein AAF206_25480, partial [Bacteroidota bacterium]
MKALSYLYCICLLFLCTQSVGQNRYYVDESAPGGNIGNSWSDAFTDLHFALAVADSGDHIWVAAGTYKPGSDRDSSFALKSGISLYGGFAGTELTLSDRLTDSLNLFGLNATILSGNIGNANSADDNSYTILLARDLAAEAIVDGLTIVEGQADVLENDSAHTSSNSFGGCMLIDNSDIRINDCVFRNSFARKGAAIYSMNGAQAIISGSYFQGHSAKQGNAIFADSSDITIQDCQFWDNLGFKKNTYGGAILIQRGGGVIQNSLFFDNQAYYGAGILNLNTGNDTVHVTNCTFRDNLANQMGGGILNWSANNLTSHCSFSGHSIGETGISREYGGGGIAVRNVSYTVIDSCQFIDNQVETLNNGQGKGGAIHILSQQNSTPILFNTVEIKNSYFHNNFARSAGGLYVDTATSLIMINCVVDSNRSNSDGGGMVVEVSDDVDIINCSFTKNLSFNGNGGGLYNRKGNIRVEQTLFRENVAIQDGGGLYTRNSQPTLIRCRFESNATPFGLGGALTNWFSDTRIDTCEFINNAASDTNFLKIINPNAGVPGGGAIHNESARALIFGSYFENNSSFRGGAIYNKGGSNPEIV